MPVVRGHLLGALGSFAKRGVASAMGGFNTLHQIRKREGQARRWSKGDGGEAGGAAGLLTVTGARGCPAATQVRSRAAK